MKTSLLSVLLFVFAFSCAAKDKHLPLPVAVFSAKTVFIDNQSGMAKIGDRAYEELRKWGRFQIVSDRKDADLIFLLSAEEHTTGYVTSGGGQTGTVNESGNINTTSKPTYTTPQTVGHTFLTVFDAKSGTNSLE